MSAGYMRRWPLAALAVENGKRAAPLMPPEVVTAIPDVMGQLTNVFGATTREVLTEDRWANRQRSMDAARMLRISGASLDPP